MALRDAVDAVLANGVESGAVPGVTAVVTDRNGLIYEGAFGTRSLDGGTDMTVDTVGWIASMTKAVTGAAAMKLVEAGDIELDAPASIVLPELADRQVLDGFEADGTPKLRDRVGEITLRNLLTHTSGFTYEIWNADMGAYMEATGTPGVTTCENAALNLPLAFDPGARWDYGIGIDFAGKMVEAVSGQRLGAFMRDYLFEPLGMTDTGFAITKSMAERLSGVHARTEDGSLAPMEFGLPPEPEFQMGGGGLYSTVGDYAAFMRMILNEGRAGDTQVLAPETVAEMSRNNMGDLRVQELVTAIPPYSNNAELFPGLEKSWGLTFQINEQAAPTGRPAGSLSWAGLANSYYWIDPTNGIAGSYMTQILPFADGPSLGLFEAMETAVYDSI